MALIELKEVSKVYTVGDETLRVLGGVSLSIDEGEFVSITGPSGSGKSTLMNILGLLDVPTAGSSSLDGHLIREMSDDDLSKLRNQKIGFVFQSFHLLPRVSALRNVEMPLVYSASYDHSYSKTKIREMAVEALTKVSLADRMQHKSNELSGGQRQRVAIARALVNKPKILLADEPTGNLDSRSGAEILKIFQELHRQGVTIIMVTHDPGIAAKANRVVSVRDGQIISDGKP